MGNDRSQVRSRDVHALNDDGMVACNPRDREAAHRADVGDISTSANANEVTCEKCLAVIRRATAG